MSNRDEILADFLRNWNFEFPNYQLDLAHLKDPYRVMGALLEIFKAFGINCDVIMAPPPEENLNSNLVYYQDLLPVINVIRIVKYFLSSMLQVDKVKLTHLIQPTSNSSNSLLFFLFNILVFYKERSDKIAPYENELFSKNDKVKMLQERKTELIEALNKRAQEKAERAEKLELLEREKTQIDNELKPLKELIDKEKQELDAIMKVNKQKENVLEQKKAQRDALLEEKERLTALRVYDSGEIKTKVAQAAQNSQELEQKLCTLGDVLKQKETSLKNLQTIKPSLDTANVLLRDIIKHTECLKDFENSCDPDSDNQEGILELLTELCELQNSLGELTTARNEAAQARSQAEGDRHLTTVKAESSLREAKDSNTKHREKSKKSTQRIEEIKALTLGFEEEKAKGIEELSSIKTSFTNELKSMDELLLKRLGDFKKHIEEKLRSRHG